ncbi:MAG: hypothetical protein LBG75_02430 [Candidatus Nomurabacteria bacterium]|jgi:hypothetical protein|nr:hypothetical protein [Candidatus Nomurabacteria bacterium]
MSRVEIVVTAPLENADAIRQVLGEAYAGVQGEYGFCSFSVVGKGRFLPGDKANPHIGKPNKPEVVEEERIEVVCDREIARPVIAKLRAAHPYEEPAIDVYELLNEEGL